MRMPVVMFVLTSAIALDAQAQPPAAPTSRAGTWAATPTSTCEAPAAVAAPAPVCGAVLVCSAEALECEQPQQVMALVAWVFKWWFSTAVTEPVKAALTTVAIDTLKSLGRKAVQTDTGKDVETVSFNIQGQDTNGDGKADRYTEHSEVEDHDGDGKGDDPADDEAADLDDLKADIAREIRHHDHWLREHNR